MTRAFDVLQQAVVDQLSLAHLDYSLPIFLTTDASTLGVGGSLENRYRDEEGNEVRRVVACASHAFTPAEQRWKTLEQEAFAVVWLIMYFRALLWGHPFVIETDHRKSDLYSRRDVAQGHALGYRPAEFFLYAGSRARGG
jgi:hypothetical protein